MQAIVMRETGDPGVLRLEDRPVPDVAPGEVLVAAEAIGVNFVDTRIRSGAVAPMKPATLPEVPGGEAAGTVVAVGEGVDPARIGTRVATMGGSGAYAEYLTTPAEAAIPIPDNLSSEDAVAVAAQGATALALLRAAALTGRETVLIESAAGGVGGYLVQLARELGARRVIATAGSAAKREMALALGADAVLDHYAPDWPSQVRDPIDVVFEFIGGACAGQLLDVLVPGSGRMLFCGVLSGEPPAITPMDLLLHGVGLIGCGGRPSDYSTGKATGWSAKVEAARPEILHRAATGGIRPRIDSTFPLADAARAHQRLEERRAAGKVILLPALPRASRSQHGVVGVMGARGGRGGSRPGFVDQDDPVVVEELGDFIGLVVIEATVLAWGQLREVMAADEQGAARRDGVQQTVQRGVLRLAGEREVLGGHQVVGGRRGRLFGQIGAAPLDPVGHAARRGGAGTTVQRHGREVGGGDLPAPLRQPERVTALAGVGVEGPSGHEAGDLGDEHSVGCAAEELVAAAVPVIPELSVHCHGHNLPYC